MSTQIKCPKCGAVDTLVDVDRRPGTAQAVLAVNPPRVWAECTACGERSTVLANLRYKLSAPSRR